MEISTSSFKGLLRSARSEEYGSLQEESLETINDYDFCIAFPAATMDDDSFFSTYIDFLSRKGCKFLPEAAVHVNGLVMAPMGLTKEALISTAEKSTISILLDETELKSTLETQADTFLRHQPDITPMKPHECISTRYDRRFPESLFHCKDFLKETTIGTELTSAVIRTPFYGALRLKLVEELLQASDPEEFRMRRLLMEHKVHSYFPLHQERQLKTLQDQWGPYPSSPLPLSLFRDYFGETLALYFGFLQHLADSLVTPALVGLLVQVFLYVVEDGVLGSVLRPVFSLFVGLWAVVMQERWRVKEQGLALKWGTIDFEKHEPIRPEFYGESLQSVVTGQQTLYFPTNKKRLLLLKSFLVTAAAIFLVLLFVSGLFTLRIALIPLLGLDYAQLVVSLINAVQIQLLNWWYHNTAVRLTEGENQRTDSMFHDSFIAKLFVFQFVNSYAALFYLAFIAPSVGKCPSGGCKGALSEHLLTVYLVRLGTGLITQGVMPYLNYHYQKHSHTTSNTPGAHMNGKKTPATGVQAAVEKQLLMPVYDPRQELIADYMEVVIGFGYTALFLPCLPLLAAFAWLFTVAQVKGDGWKLFVLFQRPMPVGTADVGIWQSILLVLSVCAVITNGALISFTLGTFSSPAPRLWFFICFQWLCFSLQFCTASFLPDKNEVVLIQQQRKQFIVGKLREIFLSF